jgi:16S rRNA (guanine527-N7)-methyltransferase
MSPGGVGGLERDAGDVLEAGLRQLGISCTPEQLEGLLRYQNELRRWNRRMNLVAGGEASLTVRHVLDSLAGLPVVASENPTRAADVGSGAGLPGVPLALCMPAVRWSLVERSGRRAAFLRNAVAVLRLSNAHVVEADVQEVRELFDVVTTRAFAPFSPDSVAWLLRLLRPAGRLVAYKGTRSRIDQELSGVPCLSAQVVPVSVPFLQEARHLVVLRPGQDPP